MASPSPMPPHATGDLVDVKGHGRATVLEVGAGGRCLVEYEEDGTRFHCNPSKLRRLRPSASRVVVAYRTEHYRAAAVHNVARADVCLEVGCHNGTTTRILHNRCRHAVGIDNVPLMVEEARARMPHVRFEVADGFDLEQVRALSPTGSFTKCFVDLSGKAPLSLVARLLALYLDAFPDSQIIIKSEKLFDYLESLEGQQAQQSGQAAQQHAEQQQQQPQQAGEAGEWPRQQTQRQEWPARLPAAGGAQAQQAAGPPGELPKMPTGTAAQGTGATEVRQGSSCRRPGEEQPRQSQQQADSHPGRQGGESGQPAAPAAASSRAARRREAAAAAAAADPRQLAALAPLCELFRDDDYISHSIKPVPRKAGSGQGDLEPAGR